MTSFVWLWRDKMIPLWKSAKTLSTIFLIEVREHSWYLYYQLCVLSLVDAVLHCHSDDSLKDRSIPSRLHCLCVKQLPQVEGIKFVCIIKFMSQYNYCPLWSSSIIMPHIFTPQNWFHWLCYGDWLLPLVYYHFLLDIKMVCLEQH